MSMTPAADVQSAPAPTLPRVRHQARDALVLMAFSAVTSATLAGCLLLLGSLGRQG